MYTYYSVMRRIYQVNPTIFALSTIKHGYSLKLFSNILHPLGDAPMIFGVPNIDLPLEKIDLVVFLVFRKVTCSLVVHRSVRNLFTLCQMATQLRFLLTLLFFVSARILFILFIFIVFHFFCCLCILIMFRTMLIAFGGVAASCCLALLSVGYGHYS